MDKTEPEGTQPTPAGEDKPDSQKKGCLFGLGCAGIFMLGCLGAIVLTVIIFLGISYWFTNNIVSDKPLNIPEVYITEKEREHLDDKLTRLRTAIDNRTGETVHLKLNQKELSYLLQKSDKKGQARAHVLISSDDKLTFLFSAPFTKKESYFLNLSGKGKFEISNGDMLIELDRLKIGKFKFPRGEFLKSFSEGLSDSIPSSDQYQALPFIVKEMKVKDEIIDLKIKVKKGSSQTLDKNEIGSPSPAVEKIGEEKEPTDENTNNGK